MNNELTAALATIEKCREITNCPDGVDLQDWVKQLAAENVGLKQIVDSVTDLSNEPEYHSEGMGCGLEDRGITDRYDACRHGWDEAMERVYGEVIPCADELDFSATDRIVAGIKAEVLPANIEEIIDSGDLETICWQHEHYKAEDYRLALYRFRTDREGAK